jgi:hypothetical protein
MMTNEEIGSLIKTPKRPVGAIPAELRLEGQYRRGEIDLQAQDGHNFRMFVRAHLDYVEIFSIGLVYLPIEDTPPIVLLRCNGAHGLHETQGNSPPHHRSPHIHIATENMIISGRRPESYVELTDRYNSLPEAFAHFIYRCSIIGADRAFDILPTGTGQMGLFDDTDQD